MDLLLFSNSTSDQGYLTHALEPIATFCSGARRALFVPYAAVDIGWDEYEKRVVQALQPTRLHLASLHRADDPVEAIHGADVIVVGGGNTFHLLHHCRRRGVLGAISAQVRAGARYVGWSAGANLVCPTLRTTNDMPVIDPGGFEALDLVPFQINPHYINALPPGHHGESRDARIGEFTRVNPAVPVLGLPEGDWVEVHGEDMRLHGPHPAYWFVEGRARTEVLPGLLATPVGTS